MINKRGSAGGSLENRSDVVTLHLPANAEFTPLAVAAAREYATRLGLEASDTDRVCLALEEAIQYALSFSYGGGDDELHITFSRSPLGLQQSLRWKGLPLEEEALPQFDPLRLREKDDTAGLSSFLIRNMVDQSSFALLADGNREITMFTQFPPLPVAGTPLPVDAPSKGTNERIDTSHHLRLATPEDAEDISRLALRAHGTVLFNEEIYYPARLREALAEGSMVSVVAETERGELIGHGALVTDSPQARVAELTYGFVDPRFRSHHCSWDIAARLLDIAVERGLQALIAMAVTSHVHSQRSILHLGLHECALVLSTSPASRVWQQNCGKEPVRIGNLVFVRYLGEMAPAPLYAPERHRPMLERICEHIGRPVHFQAEAPTPLPQSESCIQTYSDFKEGWVWMHVETYGADTIPRIAEQLHLARAGQVPAVQLLLPLSSPLTPTMCVAAEELGFFFAGLGPAEDGGEVLVLQQLNGVDPCFDAIRIHTEFGRELLAYVRSCAPEFGEAAAPASPEAESVEPRG